MFAMHGAQKLFGFMGKEAASFTGGMNFFGLDVGLNMIWLAGFIEFFGGILIILGLFTRWAALWSAILMVMAYLSAHSPLGNPESASWINPLANRGELAALYFLVWVAVFAFGPGPYSLDAKWCPNTKKELKKKYIIFPVCSPVHKNPFFFMRKHFHASQRQRNYFVD